MMRFDLVDDESFVSKQNQSLGETFSLFDNYPFEDNDESVISNIHTNDSPPENENNDYFREYCKSGSSYPFIRSSSSANTNPPLYLGSDHTLLDFSEALLNLKKQFSSHIGDRLMAGIVGICATMLPPNNILRERLKKSKSVYTVNQLLLRTVSDGIKSELSCHTFFKCQSGCMSFSGVNANRDTCRICGSSKETAKLYYYLPVSGRLTHLLQSSLLKGLFEYEKFRELNEDMINDVFDGTGWKKFTSKMQEDEIFIGIELCWDGTQPFKYGKESMWPITYCILNFPPVIRGKIHLGLHMLGIDDGDHAIWETVVHEFNTLWLQGLLIDNIRYRVAIVRITMDGRGLEFFTKTEGLIFYAYSIK
jgi:hypothetical protein